MKKFLLVSLLVFQLFSCSSSGSVEDEIAPIERLTIQGLNPSKARIYDTVSVFGKRLDLIDKIRFFHEKQEGTLDEPYVMSQSSFVSHTSDEISFRVPSWFYNQMKIDFLDVDKTVKILDLAGWVPLPHVFKDIVMVEAPSDQTAFVFDGNEVLRSTDAYETWTPVFQSPHRVIRIFFLNDQLGWIVDYDGRIARFHVTEDGGDTFDMEFEFQSSSIDKIFFESRHKGYFVEQHRLVYTMRVYDNGVISNAFDYFRQLTPEKLGSSEIFDFQVNGNDSFFLWPVNSNGSLYILNKDGLTKSGSIQNLTQFPQLIGDIGYAISGGRSLFKSVDGGFSWTQMMQFEGEYGSSLYFLDSNHGFVRIGPRNDRAILYETFDGGESWEKKDANSVQFQLGWTPVESSKKLVWIKGGGRRLYRFLD